MDRIVATSGCYRLARTGPCTGSAGPDHQAGAGRVMIAYPEWLDCSTGSAAARQA